MKIIISKSIALKVAKESARMCQTLSSVPGLKGFERFGNEVLIKESLKQTKKDLKGAKIVEQKRYLRIEQTETDIIMEVSDKYIEEHVELQHKLVTASIPVIGAVQTFANYAKDVCQRFANKWEQEGGLK